MGAAIAEFARAGMAGVLVAFIVDLERRRRERGVQARADRIGASAHGNALRNGRTLTSR